MITISTTSDQEARAVAGLMNLVPHLDYRIYLLGREVDPDDLLRLANR